MKVVAVSDLHGHLPEVVPCDLLLIAGDICPAVNHSLGFQRAWLDGRFRRWLEGVPARKVVGIAGNHDHIFQEEPGKVPSGLRWTYLQDSGTEVDGLKVWGTPWQLRFCDWSFNADAHEIGRHWDKIPAGTDVLVVHGPPYDILDAVQDRGVRRRCGCPQLRKRIEELGIPLVVFGHIHSGRGVLEVDGRWHYNATLVDEGYRPVYGPWVIDWDSLKGDSHA